MQQFDLPVAWNTDECNLSGSESMLKRARKYIGCQVRFDSKPLGIAMCYCCGSILWSRVDNCHTNLVDLCIAVENIPAVAYQKRTCTALEYRVNCMHVLCVNHLNHHLNLILTFM